MVIVNLEQIRGRLVDLKKKKVLIANLKNSLESKDDYTKINCSGYGRIRVYKNYSIHLSLPNQNTRKPLFRGHPPVDVLRTQVFQLAGCNWRCWYCFVDFKLLSANPIYGKYFTTDELISMYLKEKNPPHVIDLSGGQPDLVPEWCLWTMQTIEKFSLKNKVYIWLDDNLGTDIMWDVLTPKDIEYMAHFPKHSRVCCFKGYDQKSFEFNTGQKKLPFDIQFDIFKKLYDSGFDLYTYVTFTAPKGNCNRMKIKYFIDRLQNIHPNLPLRTIPLEIKPFTATKSRMGQQHEDAIKEQLIAYNYWWDELTLRFSTSEINQPYDKIPIR